MSISFFESFAHIDWLFKSAHINIATLILFFARQRLGVVIHTNSILSGQPFFSNPPVFATHRVCFFSRIIFPVMSNNFIQSRVAFFAFFPLEYHDCSLTTFPLLDDSLYVPKLCLGGSDSIFSCPSMDFGFSLTSVVLLIFVLLSTRIYV